MFNSVSWSEYFVFVAITGSLYYLCIWIFFFKARIPAISQINRSISLQTGDGPDEVFATAQHVMDEIRPLFQQRRNKNELLLAIRQRLKPYSQWNEPEFRECIDRFIVSQFESTCSILLSKGELREVWL